MFPDLVPTATALDPPPITGKFAVNAAALVVHVVQVIVPVVVMVPPPIGDVVAIEVTVPDPPPPPLGGVTVCPNRNEASKNTLQVIFPIL